MPQQQFNPQQWDTGGTTPVVQSCRGVLVHTFRVYGVLVHHTHSVSDGSARKATRWTQGDTPQLLGAFVHHDRARLPAAL